MAYKDKEREKLFWVWSDMCQRCKNSNHKAYKNYGGRGITVCERWQTFQNFINDMSPRPAGLMLERIDNDRGYSPENCQWVTRKQQNSNRRNCIYVNKKGQKTTLKEFCRKNNLKYRPICKRIKRGWSVVDAVSVPVGGVFKRGEYQNA